ncbi:MAG: hypothetical protein H8E66_33010 [Planctomycetes bacterium]|nr:hypothetical protein [Planctomycetota bacterium]
MRFSLKTLFIWTSASAMYLAVVFAMPAVASYICLVLATFLMAPVVVVGVVYDRGYARTFWIGCAVSGTLPLLLMIYMSLGGFYLPLYGDSDEERIPAYIFAGCHGLVGLSGVIAVGARWLIERKNRVCQSDIAVDRSILHGRVTVAELRSSELKDE